MTTLIARKFFNCKGSRKGLSSTALQRSRCGALPFFGLGGHFRGNLSAWWSEVNFSWQASKIRAVALPSADFVASAALWTWWWSLVALCGSDFVAQISWQVQKLWIPMRRFGDRCNTLDARDADFVAGKALCDSWQAERFVNCRFCDACSIFCALACALSCTSPARSECSHICALYTCALMPLLSCVWSHMFSLMYASLVSVLWFARSHEPAFMCALCFWFYWAQCGALARIFQLQSSSWGKDAMPFSSSPRGHLSLDSTNV